MIASAVAIQGLSEALRNLSENKTPPSDADMEAVERINAACGELYDNCRAEWSKVLDE